MVAAAPRRAQEGLVPFDPRRHLRAVADLMVQTFAAELGPGGRLTLRHLQRMARWGSWGLWLWGTESGVWEAPGFVWLEEGQVVGNISLRRTASPGGWMIGNVAVRPEWRGRSIGRALVEAAVNSAAERGGAWVGLEVREDSPVARGLYERMGFQTVGTTVELARPAVRPWPAAPSAPRALRRAGSADSEALYRLAQEGLSLSHRDILEIRPAAYQAGWEARVNAWLEGRREDWWMLEEEGRPVGALRISSHRSARWHEMEILVGPERLEPLGSLLVEAGLGVLSRRRPWETTTVLAGARKALEPMLAAAGFRPMRRLVQMRLALGRQLAFR